MTDYAKLSITEAALKVINNLRQIDEFPTSMREGIREEIVRLAPPAEEVSSIHEAQILPSDEDSPKDTPTTKIKPSRTNKNASEL